MSTTQAVSLLTGGAGFIGAHVARELLQLGHRVIVLDDLSGGQRENLPDGVHFIQGSINDQRLVATLFEEHQFEYVYHLAAYAAEGLSHFIRRFNYENNLIGSINLINESVKHKVKCFVFTSSIAVYGKGQLPMKEDLTPQPEDPYGIAKLAVELDLKAAHEMFGLNYVIFRPHNVYGEFQNLGDKYRNVVGIFMNQLMQDKSLTIFGDGMQTRAFSYIGDVAPHIAGCVHLPVAYNQIINIGADTDYTVKDLAEAVCVAMGKAGKIQFLDARNEVMHAYSDHSKARQIFGENKQTTLQEGLEKMAQWAWAAGSRSSSDFGEIEITEKLPASWTTRS
ncbi:MAG: NAD-dependent epimerase/dehydratase family protein [Flavobacteriales bacterium]|nr:NAD-dependent epimerase/dehydratase family protein [Flavobacteriales bacterium]